MSGLADMPVLVVPGLEGSGPSHWQSRWLALHPGWRRVEQVDWCRPESGAWVSSFDRYVQQSRRPPVVVAHSLGCAVVARWASAGGRRLAAALLVAPADVDSPMRTPDCVRSFAPMPTQPLPFASLVVASQDDPYVEPARARAMARAWGSDFTDLGECGHINADSGLGDWNEGLAMLARLIEAGRRGGGNTT